MLNNRTAFSYQGQGDLKMTQSLQLKLTHNVPWSVKGVFAGPFLG
uniref:Uncharacterized protein n=1 Tax=Anguilla anguilla TaxID=7936 RepID=A0A0E9WUF0_ANGAN